MLSTLDGLGVGLQTESFPRSRPATVSAEPRWPCRVSSQVHFVVHLSGDIRSPRPSGSTKASSADRSPGPRSTAFFRPSTRTTDPPQQRLIRIQFSRSAQDRADPNPGRNSDEQQRGAGATMKGKNVIGVEGKVGECLRSAMCTVKGELPWYASTRGRIVFR